MPTYHEVSVTPSELADGDVVQLVEDKTALKRGHTPRLYTGSSFIA